MNFYPRFPAHYVAKTLHLTMEQDGAYSRLLDWCYMNERPIPDEQRYAIARATKLSEKRAVNFVIREFFSLTSSGWENERVSYEIERARPAIDAAKANGRKGGRPRKPPNEDNPPGYPLGYSNITHEEPSSKAPHTPYLKEPTDSACATLAGQACVEMKRAGCGARVNPSHPDLIAALAEGVTPKMLADTVTEGIAGGKGEPFTWAIKTARNRHAAGASAVTGESHGNHQSGRRESVAERAARFAREGNEADARRANANQGGGHAEVLGANGGDLREPMDSGLRRAM